MVLLLGGCGGRSWGRELSSCLPESERGRFPDDDWLELLATGPGAGWPSLKRCSVSRLWRWWTPLQSRGFWQRLPACCSCCCRQWRGPPSRPHNATWRECKLTKDFANGWVFNTKFFADGRMLSEQLLLMTQSSFKKKGDYQPKNFLFFFNCHLILCFVNFYWRLSFWRKKNCKLS